ncbi:MAG: tripartite tricarboxylate transporter substrate binding protein [Betaproteobacteria bacterium]|nr:tripartite tricarboxylate transporter substrate binding protein [Betaproteobacteria bacterium]
MKTGEKTLGLFLALALAFAFGESAAQSYPSKPIRFVTGNQTGGGTDLLARAVSQRLSEQLGQQVIVENKPGADGIIAADYVAKSASDGYTFLVGTDGQMTLNPGLYAKVPYDPIKDFIPVIQLSSNPVVFAVHPKFPATKITDLIAMAKAKPGALFYASGAASFRVTAELFKLQTGVNIVHVPYKGGAPSVSAAIAGEVAVVVTATSSVLAQLRTGQLRALVVTSPKRTPLLPDVPTMAESGVANFEVVTMQGLFAPAKTPRAIVDKVYNELSLVLKLNDVKERFAFLGLDPGGMASAEYGALLEANLAKWTKVLRDLNIRAE